ncbi:Hypothetical predicted protein, partial [Paramuricea clavata]
DTVQASINKVEQDVMNNRLFPFLFLVVVLSSSRQESLACQIQSDCDTDSIGIFRREFPRPLNKSSMERFAAFAPERQSDSLLKEEIIFLVPGRSAFTLQKSGPKAQGIIRHNSLKVIAQNQPKINVGSNDKTLDNSDFVMWGGSPMTRHSWKTDLTARSPLEDPILSLDCYKFQQATFVRQNIHPFWTFISRSSLGPTAVAVDQHLIFFQENSVFHAMANPVATSPNLDNTSNYSDQSEHFRLELRSLRDGALDDETKA